jgi:hypothetical protein
MKKSSVLRDALSGLLGTNGFPTFPFALRSAQRRLEGLSAIFNGYEPSPFAEMQTGAGT